MIEKDRTGSDTESSPAAEPLPAGGTEPAVKPGILIVDDDQSVTAMLALGLALHGFTVWSANSSEAALALYQKHRQDIAIVILDVQMPDRDGPQTLAALQALNPEIRCCMMSGNTGQYTGEQLRNLGTAWIFEKPFGPSHVVQVLRQLLG